MHKALPFPLNASQPNARPDFNVVIAYEDLETGRHAKRAYDQLVQHMQHECDFSNQMWKFEVLAVSKLRELAARDAAAADIIIVSAHQTHELPFEVNAWIETWLKEGTQALALVALFDAPDLCGENEACKALADVARRGKIEFFSQPELDQRQDLPTHIRYGSHRDFAGTYSVLSGVMQDHRSNSHWGINE